MKTLDLTRHRILPQSLFKRLLHDFPGVVSIGLFFALCFVLFALVTDNFLSGANLLNVIRQNAPLLIVAVAMTLVVTTGGIDLSVGSTLALVGALAAMALNTWHLPWPLVLLGGLAVGAMIGALNGYFIAYAGIPAFIVTLATLTIIRGLAMLLTQGYSIPVPREETAFLALGRGWFL
ncbi:ABC transporter permease, partial [Pseudomonas syringae]